MKSKSKKFRDWQQLADLLAKAIYLISAGNWSLSQYSRNTDPYRVDTWSIALNDRRWHCWPELFYTA
jgi:hypothetical protein